MKRHLKLSQGFSLIEMVVAMMVIGIISGFVVPAFNGFGRSSSLTSAGNAVANMANFARQEAMTKNTMTALLVLANQGTDDDYRAVTVLEYDTVTGWSQALPWEKLPDGVMVDCSDTTNCSFLENSPKPFPFLTKFGGQNNPPVSYQGQQVASSGGYIARLFLSNGSLQNPEEPAQLRLVQGYRQGQSVVYTQPNASGKAANYYDIAIVGTTGTTKIDRP